MMDRPSVHRLLMWSALLLLAAASFSSAQPAPTPHAGTPMPETTTPGYALSGLTDALVLPVDLQALDDGSGRFLVTQLEGLVVIVHPDGHIDAAPFLDLRHRVTALRGEQGMFSAALEPAARPMAIGRSRHLVVAFVERGSDHLVVAAYPIDATLSSASTEGEVELLRVEMQDPFHHGGQVLFGPDGLLYLSVGEGQLSVEHLKRPPFPAQDLGTMRGKVLRLELLPMGQDGPPYAIPEDNPFVGTIGALPEIWALGLRNPWKMDFDPVSADLYLSDVGADRWEEVNLVVPGGNYGWPAREGRECQLLPFDPGYVDASCPEQDGYLDPLVSVAHLREDPNGGQSVTGGAFAHDPELPELWGHFVFGDFITGRLWAYDPADGEVRLLLTGLSALSEVARDQEGRIWLLTIPGGLARLVYDSGD